MNKFRTLNADEIECRVDFCDPQRGVTLLLYKDARCDMAILDETVGAENWQDIFREAKGTLFCSIGIKCGDEWVWKGDAGEPSAYSAIKGEASDARKRAGVCWGIGRELYTAPFIWISADKIEWRDKANGKKEPKTTFRVSDISYDEKRRIAALTIVSGNGDVVYQHGKKTQQKPTEKPQDKPQPVLCPVCGKEVKSRKAKTGETLTPEQVLEACGGMCSDCYKQNKKMKEVQNNG